MVRIHRNTFRAGRAVSTGVSRRPICQAIALLPLAPLQLGSQHTEQPVGVVAEEADAVLGPLAVDGITLVQFDGLLSVYCEVDLVGNAYDFYAYGRFAGCDDGADREQVGTDGGDHQRVDAGHDDGAVGGEVVGG